ncbi:MAG: diacylglycerol kinase family lipid kinase [Desulfuromonadales bacterium]|nr:MAG: diacylglycerol kinase family lipid kinase [Desulfuromonadales bacterium]
MPLPCTLIINPTSGSHTEPLVQRVVSSLASGGYAPRVLLTGGPDDAAAFAARICAEQECPLIVAGGGDGTVNGVINGLEPGRATLAVLPFGTANVLARELGIATVDAAVARIVRNETRPMTVGLLEGFGVRRRFCLMAGAGFDGFVVEGVRLGEKKRFGKGAYLLSALRTLSAWDRRMMDVTAGAERRLCHSVIVCNASRYGGSFRLAPGASIFEPGFQVVCIGGTSRLEYLRFALSVVAGGGARGPSIATVQSDTLTIGGNKPVQVDGDFLCHTPVTVSSLPAFLNVVV